MSLNQLRVRKFSREIKPRQPVKTLKVAMIGDSTCRDFSIGSTFQMLLKCWVRHQNNPFLNFQPDAGYESVFERLNKMTPTHGVLYACPGALVGPTWSWSRRQIHRYSNIRTMGGQVSALLKEAELPQVTLIWIGHNNLNFIRKQKSARSSKALDDVIREMRLTFIQNFRLELRRLLEGLKAEPEPRSIIVYGLVNPEASSKARAQAKELKEKNPTLFPYFEKSEDLFEPLKPQHWERMNQLSYGISLDLKNLVEEISASSLGGSQIRLFYSDATTEMDFSDPRYLHERDAWHPSSLGKEVVAKALFEGMTPALKFMGVTACEKN